MIKQVLLFSFLSITLSILSPTSFAEKLDKSHRCYQELCEGNYIIDDYGEQIKIVLIIPTKSVLTYSYESQKFRNLSWDRFQIILDNTN
jgi:hypothetical protein